MAQDSSAASLEGLSAQLKYLNDAAHLMALTAPSCSSHLMSRSNLLMFSNDIDQSDSHRRHICGGCGNIMIPGWTASVEKETLRQQKRKRIDKSRERATAQPTASSMVYTCDRCGRKTPHSISKAPPVRRNTRGRLQSRPSTAKAPEHSSSLLDSKAPVETPAAVSANASSKKRAKNRKQSGLQALLAKNKESSQSSSGGFGLDLLDLMKHG